MLLVHAHPDDETINNGATMARYVAEGAQVTLLTCTLGEEGEVLVPELAQLAADQADQLGGYRICELRAAMDALGVTDLRFLGGAGRYRDSGMMGTPANENPRAFWNADLDEAVAHAVAVVREIRPQVVVTYDENGGYGHPDHIQAHRVAMGAVEAAADPAYRPDLGEAVVGGEGLLVLHPAVGPAAGHRRDWPPPATTPSSRASPTPTRSPSACPTRRSRPPSTAGRSCSHKDAAMRAHPTQIMVDGPFFALSNNLGMEVLGHRVLPAGARRARARPDRAPHGWEDDLFAGLSG